METLQPTVTVVDNDYCLSDITLEDFYVSVNQVHAMQGANGENKRHAVYIPAALGVFGLGSLLPDEATTSPSAPPVLPCISPESIPEDVVERLKKRESSMHNRVRTSMQIAGDVVKSPPTDESGSELVIISIGRDMVDRSGCVKDSCSWISVQCPWEESATSSEDEPRVRFSPHLTTEVLRAVS